MGEPIKVSIIISIYNSHKAVCRQVKYFNAMDLPDSIEIIFIDDGSSPPLNSITYQIKNFNIYETHNTLAWTQGLGRNLGASKALGTYLFFTDIDHIISREAIRDAIEFSGNRMFFPRYLGVLLEDGTFTQDPKVLSDYGVDFRLLGNRGLYASMHMNTFIIKRETFEQLGGYSYDTCTWGYHPKSRRGDDCYFNGKWNRWARRNGVTADIGSKIYMFPVGRYHSLKETNPHGLFHDLSYDTVPFKKGDEVKNQYG